MDYKLLPGYGFLSEVILLVSIILILLIITLPGYLYDAKHRLLIKAGITYVNGECYVKKDNIEYYLTHKDTYKNICK